MRKDAGFITGPIKVLLTRLARAKFSPLGDYYANLARKGMEAGYEGRTETMLPSTGAMALSTLGPATGVLDHIIGTQVGQELRHATDKARQQLAVTHPMAAAAVDRYDPKFQDIANLLNPVAGAVRPFPISKRNYRRLKRFVSSKIENPVARAALQSRNPLVEQAANYGIQKATTSSAPLIRNMARAVQGPGPSPLAERVARATIKPVAPHHNAELMLASTGASTAANVLTGAMNPLGALTGMALPLAEAALIRKAEQGRAGSLASLKMRMIGNMAEPKPGVMPFLERTGQRVWSAVDPNVDEFSRVGADINKTRRAALLASHTLEPEQAARSRAAINQAAGALTEQGSTSTFVRNLAQDFAPEIHTAKRIAAAIPAAVAAMPRVTARAAGAVGRATLPNLNAPSPQVQHMQNLLAPQQRAGFINFMESGKTAAVRHHLSCVTVQRRDGKVRVCPHCHNEVNEKDIYRDAKGWCFHRPCFTKGKGSILIDKEGSVPLRALALGSAGGALGMTGKVPGITPLRGALAGAAAGALSDYIFPSVSSTAEDSLSGLPEEQRNLLQRKFKHITDTLGREGAFTGTAHKRIVVPHSFLSGGELQNLGFLRSSVAVPEQGQKEFSTWRHPHNLYHFHTHPEHWTVHEDVLPSLDMLRYKAKHPMQRIIKDLPSGMGHIFTEGVPGYFTYLKNQAQGLFKGEDETESDPVAAQAAVQRGKLPRGIIRAIVKENPNAMLSAKAASEAPVIHEQQTNDYNCGPAALKAVENTMGVGHPDQKSYQVESGADSDNGTPITSLEQTAAGHGLQVNSQGQMDLNQLQKSVQAGKPVIVAVQLDGEGGGPASAWNSGHYVVVTGIDNGQITFMDPSSESPERSWPIEEFVKRWHDHDHKGQVYNQWGMTLHMPGEAKQAYSGSLGSGATSGQATNPPRLMDASGATPAGPENQPASDGIKCDNAHLDMCDQDPDPAVFDMNSLDPGYQDSGSGESAGRMFSASSPALQSGQSAQNSGAMSAPNVEGPAMQLDSDTASTGQPKHLNA